MLETDVNTYDVSEFVADLRHIASSETDERRIVKLLEPHMRRLAQTISTTPGWIRDEYYECDTTQGFGLHLLHEDGKITAYRCSCSPGYLAEARRPTITRPGAWLSDSMARKARFCGSDSMTAQSLGTRT